MLAAGFGDPVAGKKLTHSEDGKTWTFTLRDDVKYSNGEPVRCRGGGRKLPAQCWITVNVTPGWSWQTRLFDVKALRKTELQITLKSAYYPFLQELALPRPFRFIAPLAV
ncbi:ABC transporter substrate-binding protein [Escherichia coli]